MAFIICTPPFAVYLNNLPTGGGMRALNRTKGGKRCANPNCKVKLTKEQVRRKVKYHSRACGRTVMRNVNALKNFAEE